MPEEGVTPDGNVAEAPNVVDETNLPTAENEAPDLTIKARQLAEAHSRVSVNKEGVPLLTQVEAQGIFLHRVHQFFTRQSQEETIIPSQAAEWVLDNFYIIQQTLQQIDKGMPPPYYRELPKLKSGPWQGYPRVYLLANAGIEQVAGQIEEESLLDFVMAYQQVQPLSTGELWALPIMLRIGVIEILAHTLARVVDERAPGDSRSGALITQLPADTLVGSSIVSLRTLANLDWKEFFESASLVEQTLCADPASVYPQMDFETRDLYRKVVERLAKAGPHQELDVARAAVHLARQVDGAAHADAERQRHVGYYLIDDGRPALEAEIGYRPGLRAGLGQWLIRRHPTLSYVGSIGLLSLILWGAVLGLAANLGVNLWLLILTGVVSLIPIVSFATALVNWVMTATVKPGLLPKLDFEEGIPATARTMVVIPTLLSRQEDVDPLVNELELHYLRNTDPHITFGLLSDFSDAADQSQPEDDAVLQYAEEKIRALNEHYANNPFYFFHRRRLWNPQEGSWMGWERKRGKLEEFNRLLRGAEDTSFIVTVGDLSILHNVRYVITLDSDTVLPREAAHRLIGTLAHPLNCARFDPETGRVVAGYTVLQPRTEIKPLSAIRTHFSRIYSGISGLDLYTHAVSDVYQDLFGEGIYVGKGIYEIDPFMRSLDGRVPENALLSHDLFEGVHGRAGLVTDIILYEDYPSDYLTFSQRRHRWIRGDWQLLPWLRRRVPCHDGEYAANPLSFVDRWKIIDNLRRSLMAPALVTLLVLGWLWLPNPLLWTAIALFVSAGSLLSGVFALLIQRLQQEDEDGGGSIDVLRRQIVRWLLYLVFLPHDALVDLDAIRAVFVRLFITRRQLLQWRTSANTESFFGNKHKLLALWQHLLGAVLLAVALGLLIIWINPAALVVALPFLVVWLLSPQIALWLSRPVERYPTQLRPDQQQLLRRLARSTWLYFEQFMGPEDHWLPPDHFQEDPRGLVAHRTSPTNIGLGLLSTLAAYDFGYIGLWELSVRLQDTFRTLHELERYRGHFLNWYDTRSLKPLPPRYVSSVDSGNLAACLMILRQGCESMPNVLLPRWERWHGLLDTLAMLGNVLAEAPPQLSEVVVDLQNQLDQMQQRILDVRDEPARGTVLLRSLTEEAWPRFQKGLVRLMQMHSSSPAQLRRIRVWTERAQHDLFDMQRRLNALVPWLTAVHDAPPLLRNEKNSPVAQAWQDLLAGLPEQTHVKDIVSVCADARPLVIDLRRQLGTLDAETSPEFSAEDLDAARQWCDHLAQRLDEAIASVTALLDLYVDLSGQCEQMVQEMNFDFLYDPQRHTFRIGYNVDTERSDANTYDLLASESRSTSLIAIAKGEVPQRHWLYLGRPLTQVDGWRSLVSWSGTMFEYLMPILWTRQYENTLLDQSVHAAVQAQIAYARQKGIPWGISESGYYRFDAAMNYQYQAFGIPSLGFKRGLEDEVVITPYASLLALPLYPQAVMENIENLRKLGMWGDYGFYEALDYTPARLALGEEHATVRSFMVHHQGMILLSLVNALADDVMVKRFHADRRIQSIELLLQERVPEHAPLEEEIESEREVLRRPEREVTAIPWSVPMHTLSPQVHYLSNGKYSVLLTNAGSGYSRWQATDLTRWRADTTCDDLGDLDLYSGSRTGRAMVCHATAHGRRRQQI